MTNGSAQENTPQTVNKSRVAEIRRRRRVRKLRVTSICVLLTAMIFAYFMGAFGAPLALLGDAMDSLKIAMTPAAGFPIDFTLTGYTTAETLSGGFAALGDRELIMYSAQGNMLRRVPHGYARPCMTAGRSRVCIYSRADTELTVESRTRSLFARTFDTPIMLAEMSENGTLAVFTKKQLEVFDPLFESIWTWNNVSELPLGMAFAGDNKRLAVACLRTEGGAVGTTLHFFSTNANKEQATVAVPDGMPVKMQYVDNKLLVVYDAFVAWYNASTGEELARYDYGARQLQSVSVDSAGRAALLFGAANYPGITAFITLDASLAEIGSVPVRKNANSIVLAGKTVYILTDTAVLHYTLAGEPIAQLPIPTRPLAVLDARQPLLITSEAVAVLQDTPVNAASESGSVTSVTGALPPESTPPDTGQSAAPSVAPSAAA